MFGIKFHHNFLLYFTFYFRTQKIRTVSFQHTNFFASYFCGLHTLVQIFLLVHERFRDISNLKVNLSS